METPQDLCKYVFCFWVISCDKRYQAISSWLHTSHCKVLYCISGSSCPRPLTRSALEIEKYAMCDKGATSGTPPLPRNDNTETVSYLYW